uniref:Phosphoribosyltransferase domain-containing protein n=1 Tax=viral metagenome TaxID=1070528 RepID=A0A6C0ERX8_9ZZZZ
MKMYGEYYICQQINADLKGKNIILLDELVSSGRIMNETINYLVNKKRVNYIYPDCLSLSKKSLQ